MIFSSLSQTLVTGTYRAGSEYLSLLLNCNPALSSTMYSVNMLRFIYGKYEPIDSKGCQLSALEDLKDRLWERYKKKIDVLNIMKEFERRGSINYGSFYDVVMSSLYLTPGTSHWAEKNQLLWREIPLFLDIMPNGKVIHIVRDPRSVLLSFKNYTYAPEPKYLGAVFNCLDSMLCALEYQNKLSSESYRCIIYEELARNPQEETDKLWEFLGLQSGFDVFERSEWIDAYGKPWHSNSTAQKNSKSDPFNVEQSFFRWKTKLSEAEIQFVEGICGKTLDEFGYTKVSKEINWPETLKLIASDDTIFQYFRNWIATGRGVQAFPTNPLKPENWEERILSNKN